MQISSNSRQLILQVLFVFLAATSFAASPRVVIFATGAPLPEAVQAWPAQCVRVSFNSQPAESPKSQNSSDAGS